jgi:hypothetical protein
VPAIQPDVDRVAGQIRGPSGVVGWGVDRGPGRDYPPEQVRPGEAPQGAVDVLIVVGVGVVQSVVRHPSDRPPSEAQQPSTVRGYSSQRGLVAKLRCVRSRWYVMQMPRLPVRQCKAMQTARPDQEKYAGTKARSEPRCNPPIQRTWGQAIPADSGRPAVAVVMMPRNSKGAGATGPREGGSRRISPRDGSDDDVPDETSIAAS